MQTIILEHLQLELGHGHNVTVTRPIPRIYSSNPKDYSHPLDVISRALRDAKVDALEAMVIALVCAFDRRGIPVTGLLVDALDVAVAVTLKQIDEDEEYEA